MQQTWTLKTEARVLKSLKSLDPQDRKRILQFLWQKVLLSQNPRLYGKPLTGRLSGYWSYRIGDYRIIVDIQDQSMVICAIALGHRREVYN